MFYLHALDGIGRFTLAEKLEKALGVATTARNWHTAIKMMEMGTAVTHHQLKKTEEIMSYQAYLDTIKAKTGKTPDDFRVLAAEKRLTRYSEVMAWLKADYGLGHGHANVIAQILTKPDTSKVAPDDKIDQLFTGRKEQWRRPYDDLLANLHEFGTDVGVAATSSYISLLRGSKKFGIVQPSSERLDIGIKLKDAAPAERFEAAGSWNNMVTHRVRISDPAQIDADVLAWLKQAYHAAK